MPRGFGAAYRRVLKDHFALIANEATANQVASWDLRKRVEAVIYARIEHARASDNPVQRHPWPSWLPERPWQGPHADVSHIRSDLQSAFEGPRRTPIAEAS